MSDLTSFEHSYVLFNNIPCEIYMVGRVGFVAESPDGCVLHVTFENPEALGEFLLMNTDFNPSFPSLNDE